MNNLNLSKLLLLFLSFILISCDKEYFEKINDKSLLVPSTLADFQALLDDNRNVMNLSPWIGEISSDNFYAADAGYLAWNTELERSAYTWSTNPDATGNVSDWNTAYRQIFNTNIVLDGLQEVKGRATETEIRNIRGSALFYRGYALYNLSQIFAAPYDVATANSDPGIPVRLSADVNLRPGRGTLADTYQQILKDIKEAAELLPQQVAYKTRPSQAAAFALLARITLSMRNYEEAFKYAEQCLAVRNTLIDYNTLNLSATRAFPVLLPNGNAEVIYYSIMSP
ncbi:MAG: RagB/SusD family nutrient uptake outer membrane protein, partial [Daejeonella sp.]|nr:RagB/SusD family nutrient uptake outer membrane protein [Daejeonella sp.]